MKREVCVSCSKAALYFVNINESVVFLCPDHTQPYAGHSPRNLISTQPGSPCNAVLYSNWRERTFVSPYDRFHVECGLRTGHDGSHRYHASSGDCIEWEHDGTIVYVEGVYESDNWPPIGQRSVPLEQVADDLAAMLRELEKPRHAP